MMPVSADDGPIKEGDEEESGVVVEEVGGAIDAHSAHLRRARGVHDNFNRECNRTPRNTGHRPRKMHKAIKKAGYLGIVIYVIGFGLAELLPGLVFVTAGVICWGHFNG